MNETQKDRVYCQQHIDNLTHYDQFKYSFGDIICKDSPNMNFGFSQDVLDMICIDVDAIEARKSGQHDQTMDCACPIARFDDVRRHYSNKRLLLIEFKLNCVSVKNLTKDVYIGKSSHSRVLLRNENLHQSNVFVVTDKIINVAKYQLNRYKQGIGGKQLSDTILSTPADFNCYVGFESSFPYIPINDPNVIINSLKYHSNDFDELYEEFETWKNKADIYKYQGNSNESDNIIDALKCGVRDIADAIPNDNLLRDLLSEMLKGI